MPLIANAFKQIESGHAGHRDVEDEAIKSSCESCFECRHSVFAFVDVKTEPPKILGEQETHIGVVVRD